MKTKTYNIFAAISVVVGVLFVIGVVAGNWYINETLREADEISAIIDQPPATFTDEEVAWIYEPGKYGEGLTTIEKMEEISSSTGLNIVPTDPYMRKIYEQQFYRPGMHAIIDEYYALHMAREEEDAAYESLNASFPAEGDTDWERMSMADQMRTLNAQSGVMEVHFVKLGAMNERQAELMQAMQVASMVSLERPRSLACFVPCAKSARPLR